MLHALAITLFSELSSAETGSAGDIDPASRTGKNYTLCVLAIVSPSSTPRLEGLASMLTLPT